MNLKPISEAPRDGTIVLVWDGIDFGCCSFKSDENGDYWQPMWGKDTELFFQVDDYIFNPAGMHPTHFCELKPPTE